jgi:hypothetical protein
MTVFRAWPGGGSRSDDQLITGTMEKDQAEERPMHGTDDIRNIYIYDYMHSYIYIYDI